MSYPSLLLADTPQNRKKAIRDAVFNNGVKTITAASGTITASDANWVKVDGTTLTTLSLESAALFPYRELVIKDVSGAANTNNIVIDPYGSETIDGAATKTINTAYGSIRLFSDGVKWHTTK